MPRPNGRIDWQAYDAVHRDKAQDPDANLSSDPELIDVIEIHFYVIRIIRFAPKGTE